MAGFRRGVLTPGRISALRRCFALSGWAPFPILAEALRLKGSPSEFSARGSAPAIANQVRRRDVLKPAIACKNWRELRMAVAGDRSDRDLEQRSDRKDFGSLRPMTVVGPVREAQAVARPPAAARPCFAPPRRACAARGVAGASPVSRLARAGVFGAAFFPGGAGCRRSAVPCAGGALSDRRSASMRSITLLSSAGAGRPLVGLAPPALVSTSSRSASS